MWNTTTQRAATPRNPSSSLKRLSAGAFIGKQALALERVNGPFDPFTLFRQDSLYSRTVRYAGTARRAGTGEAAITAACTAKPSAARTRHGAGPNAAPTNPP